MRLSWRVAAAVVIAGLWVTPVSAFGHKKHGGGAAVTTVSVPTTVSTVTTRSAFATVPAFVGSAGISSISAFPTINTISAFPTINTISAFPTISAGPTVAFLPGTASNGASVASSGDLATLNASIQQLNTTMQQTNRLLARLVGDEPGGGGDGSIVDPPDSGFFGGQSAGIASVGAAAAARRLPYHLYAERQIDAAIANKDKARVDYYYRRNVEYTERVKKDLDDTQKRIDDKIKAAKAAGLLPPGP